MKTYLTLAFILLLINSPINHSFASNVEKESQSVLNVQIGVSGVTNALEFKNEGTTPAKLIYESNSPSRLGVSIGYRNLGVGFGISSSADQVELKGNSKLQDYSLRLLGKNTYAVAYQKTQGIFVKNSAQAGTGIFLQNPDFSVEKYSASWIHNFYHDDLSLPAVFSYSGRQLSSAWTVLSFLQLNKTNVSDDESLVIASEQANFTEFGQIKKIDRNSASGGFGLAGVLAYNNFQFGALVTLGGSIEEKKITQLNGNTSSDNKGSSAANLFLNAGYNAKKHQVAVTVLTSGYTTKINLESLSENINEIRVFYGYRFDGVDLGGLINGVSAWFD